MTNIDVLIPVFNAEKTISDSLDSILHQTYPPANIIVVDDGSTDRTPEILEAYSQRDERIRILTQQNSGIVEALNHGLAYATSPLIARHDADDLADPNRFRLQVEHLEKNFGCVAVSGAYRHIDELGQEIGTVEVPSLLPTADPFWIPCREPFLCHPFLMVRRGAIEAVGGYRFVFHSEDIDLYWRLRRSGTLHNLRDVLGSYRMHDQSISGSSVLNARIMAVNSQLGALSARRADRGEKDIEFPKERLQAFKSARALAAMVAIASTHLSSEEATYLRLASAAKIMDLAGYRPYELDAEDCRFIYKTYKALGYKVDADNKLNLQKQMAATAARLLKLGFYAAARTLLPILMYPEAALRLATGRLYWSKQHLDSATISMKRQFAQRGKFDA